MKICGEKEDVSPGFGFRPSRLDNSVSLHAPPLIAAMERTPPVIESDWIGTRSDVVSLNFITEQKATIRFLVDKGFNINQPERNEGSTPLHRAVVNCNAAIIPYLLSLGADKTLKTNEGLTAIELAQQHLRYWKDKELDNPRRPRAHALEAIIQLLSK